MGKEEREEQAKPNKLCPFCSSLGKPIIDKDDKDKTLVMIRCVTCNCIGGWAYSEEGAWAWWNLRA